MFGLVKKAFKKIFSRETDPMDQIVELMEKDENEYEQPRSENKATLCTRTEPVDSRGFEFQSTGGIIMVKNSFRASEISERAHEGSVNQIHVEAGGVKYGIRIAPKLDSRLVAAHIDKTKEELDEKEREINKLRDKIRSMEMGIMNYGSLESDV